jgi:ADP-heptose:LPS heptosyltransferase
MSGKRILIFRPDNIGDVLLFTGALQHIRNLYPDAHITLAVQSQIVNLVELCPYIDVCIPVGHLTWCGKINHTEFPLKYMIEQAIRVVNKLWNVISRPFDTVIYPVKSPQVPHLEIIYCLNAIQTFGIAGCSLNAPGNGYSPKLQPNTLFTNPLDVSRSDPWKHELLTTLDFLLFVGCRVTTLDDIKPQFWLADPEKNYLDGVQRNGRKIIGLFPGASSEEKHWESGNYGKLAKLVGGRPIYAIFGSSADKDFTDQVALSIREHCSDVEILNLTGQTTLRELAKTIMFCDLLISMDTSGLHMAIAASVPAIGIIGGGHFGRFVPWGDPEKNIFLTKKMECFNCNWLCINEEAECVKKVSPQEVAIAAAKLLKQEQSACEQEY